MATAGGICNGNTHCSNKAREKLSGQLPHCKSSGFLPPPSMRPRAERKSKSKRWQRIKNIPFPSFEENGYYPEDAQWPSRYLSDIQPPSEKTRQNLGPGEYVKLVFRFAVEDADRADNECERMWVLVQKTDENGNDIGVLSNDPHHDATRNGDIIHFHPLHIAEQG